MAASTTLREKRNWTIHLLYTRQEFSECLRLIDEQLRACSGMCEYALYVKGLIKRQQGQIRESLVLFQAATALNPRNAANLKQVGRSLYLLGRYKAAVEVYSEAERLDSESWEVHHSKGMCYLHTQQYADAEEALLNANSLSRHDTTYLALGQVYVQQGNLRKAIDTYLEALEYTPDNAELLTTVGLLYLRVGESYKAFEYLGNALSLDPRNPKTILAAGSIIQDHNDLDVALTKYRVAAVAMPASPQLWNNVGMAFFGKGKHVAALACLKRAAYLDPFEWITAYNLGVVHLVTGQHASAFHYLSASVSLKGDPGYAPAYMYLAVALARLEDTANAVAAYEKALMLDRSNHLLHLNYCITLCGMPAEGPGQDREDREREAADHFRRHDELFNALPPEVQEADAEVLAQRRAVSALLGIPISAGTTRAGGSGSSGGGGGGSGSGAGTGASDGASIARDAASYPGSPTAGSRF